MAAVTVTVCLTATTSCGSAKPARPTQPPHSEPLTEADLRSLLPSGKTFRGYVARPEEPRATAHPPSGTAGTADHPPERSKLYPDAPPACEALVDFELDHLLHRPTARVWSEITPQFLVHTYSDYTKFHQLTLASYSVEEAKAVMASLKGALPSCDAFSLYTLAFGDQTGSVTVGPWSAPKAGDDAVAYTWTIKGIPMDQTVPVTVVRTGGVIASYSGAVRDDIPRQQHDRLREFISGTGTTGD
ncbi:hypothetical protein CP973_39555 [Streptomyces albofaciens JCM 4342]|nr:hypothetical protein CP973_39555 [Streptomyces albofaciens JCM 4342]